MWYKWQYPERDFFLHRIYSHRKTVGGRKKKKNYHIHKVKFLHCTL